MDLNIIGNGFDLGHGLPTMYWDFRKYLENMYPEFLKAFEEHYYIYPGMITEEKKKLLWNELETNLANIDEDIIIENAVSIDMDLESGDVGDYSCEIINKQVIYLFFCINGLSNWIKNAMKSR